MSEERFDRLEHRIDGVEQRPVTIEQKADELRRHMNVLHEDTIERIAALAPDFGPIRREFSDADAKLREDLDRRLTPLEAAARARRSGD